MSLLPPTSRAVRLPLVLAMLAAVAACFAGLALSWALDWPSAATVALAACALGLASLTGRGAAPH